MRKYIQCILGNCFFRIFFGLAVIFIVLLTLLLSIPLDSPGPNGYTPWRNGWTLVSFMMRDAVYYRPKLDHAASLGEQGYLEILHSKIPKSLREPADLTPDGASQGLVLPGDLVYDFDDLDHEIALDPTDYLFEGYIVVENTREHAASLVIWESIGALNAMRSESLVKVLYEWSQQLPPTRLDVLLHHVSFMRFARNPKESPASWVETREDWRNMYRAPNPIYRLLALFTVEGWAEDKQELREVCLHALEERNTVFNIKALYILNDAQLIDEEVEQALWAVTERNGFVENDGTAITVEFAPKYSVELEKILSK